MGHGYGDLLRLDRIAGLFAATRKLYKRMGKETDLLGEGLDTCTDCTGFPSLFPSFFVTDSIWLGSRRAQIL